MQLKGLQGFQKGMVPYFLKWHFKKMFFKGHVGFWGVQKGPDATPL
jgi:hypothetical protein